MRARVLLHHETLGEERLEGRCDEAHRSASKGFSSRAATGAMSSGVEVRYQYVDAGFTWPITVDSSGKSAPTSAPASCQAATTASSARRLGQGSSTRRCSARSRVFAARLASWPHRQPAVRAELAADGGEATQSLGAARGERDLPGLSV